MNKLTDLTPSLIADRLCPPAAGPIVRQLIEAIAEKSIAITTKVPPPYGQVFAVEHSVAEAAKVILANYVGDGEGEP